MYCLFKVTAALSVMFKVDEVESVIKGMFSRFFADLLLRIGVCVGIQLSPDARKKPKPPTASRYIATKQRDTCLNKFRCIYDVF